MRQRDRLIGTREPVLHRYERITFEKDLIAPPGQPLAAFVCPGHPLLDAVVDLTLKRHRDLLRRGTVLVDEQDPGNRPRVVFSLEHAVQDASPTPSGERRVVSRRMLYVEVGPGGEVKDAGCAPYLDYRPLREDEPRPEEILGRPECAWIPCRAGEASAGVRRHQDRPRAPGGDPPPAAGVGREDPGGGEGPADEGNRLLGPPGRGASPPGAGGEGERSS